MIKTCSYRWLRSSCSYSFLSSKISKGRLKTKGGESLTKPCLFHDNARPHTAREIQALLEQLSYAVSKLLMVYTVIPKFSSEVGSLSGLGLFEDY